MAAVAAYMDVRSALGRLGPTEPHWEVTTQSRIAAALEAAQTPAVEWRDYDPAVIVRHERLGQLWGTSGFNRAAFLEAATQAPFGKGSETVVDREVRDALEVAIDGDAVRVDSPNLGVHPKWSIFNDRSIRVEPYKLVLYQPGGRFKPHRDTLRSDTHVGTVVLQLTATPDLEGGRLVVNGHPVPPTAGAAAFYTDTVHEVTEVVKGERLVLLCNVYSTSPAAQPFESVRDQLSQQLYREPVHDAGFRSGVAAAVTAVVESGVPKLALACRHLYHGAEAELKGVDALLADRLRLAGCAVELTPMVLHSAENPCRDCVEDRAFRFDAAAIAALKAASPAWDAEAVEPELTLHVPSRTAMRQLAYQEGLEYTGNEAQPEHLTYYASALVVTLPLVLLP